MKRAKYCNRQASKGDAGVILKRISTAVLAVLLAVISAGCAQGENAQQAEKYRGFVVDNVFHSENDGDIHYSVYFPESYDANKQYALYITLPGYEGLYFQGVAQNLKSEEFAFEARKYDSEMIIVAPQLEDWSEHSANQTISLTEYFLEHYPIDPDKVYLQGYSGGGETGSLVMEKRPEIYSAYLAVSSQWDGSLERLSEAKTPVYLATGENDSYYGSGSFRQVYEELYGIYEKQGLSAEEINSILVLDVRGQEYFSENGYSDQHAGGMAFAFDGEVMGWLFKRSY